MLRFPWEETNWCGLSKESVPRQFTLEALKGKHVDLLTPSEEIGGKASVLFVNCGREEDQSGVGSHASV